VESNIFDFDEEADREEVSKSNRKEWKRLLIPSKIVESICFMLMKGISSSNSEGKHQ
jgi:hypothetical protein